MIHDHKIINLDSDMNYLTKFWYQIYESLFIVFFKK